MGVETRTVNTTFGKKTPVLPVPTKDQTHKQDAGKISYQHAMVSCSLDGVARVREWAIANKYPDPKGYRQLDAQRILDACFRHLLDLMEYGIDHINEEDAGMPSLWHLQTGCAFLEDFRRDLANEDK